MTQLALDLGRCPYCPVRRSLNDGLRSPQRNAARRGLMRAANRIDSARKFTEGPQAVANADARTSVNDQRTALVIAHGIPLDHIRPASGHHVPCRAVDLGGA